MDRLNNLQLHPVSEKTRTLVTFRHNFTSISTSCAGGRHNIPRPLQVELGPFDLQSGVRVTCDVGLSVPILVFLARLVCSRPRPDVRLRQTDVRRTSSLNAPYPMGVGIIILQTSLKVIERGTILYTRYGFLLVFYRNFVPNTHRF